MLTDEQFLPADLQEDIKKLRADGVNERTLTVLVNNILHASEAKVTSLQMDIDRIETAINRRLDRIGAKMESDVQTKLGASNQMIVDIHTATQNTGAAVMALRAEFQQVGERLTSVEHKVAEHDQSRDVSIEERRLLRQDMNESKQHRARIQTTLDTELPAIRAAIGDLNERHGAQIEETERQLTTIADRLAAIEALLLPAGHHEAGG